MTSKSAVSAVTKTKKNKKSLDVLSDFKMKVAKALFNQRVLAELAATFVDTKSKNGWNQNDIAKRIKMNPTQLSRLMSGRQNNVETDTLALIALAMDYEPQVKFNPIEINKQVCVHADMLKNNKIHTYLQKEYTFLDNLRHACLQDKEVFKSEEDEDRIWVSGKTVRSDAKRLFDHV